MALTYVYAVNPLGASAGSLAFIPNSPGGVLHPAVPNAAGVLTGVSPADALFMNVQGGIGLIKLCATGATADRPTPAAALSAPGPNYSAQAPAFGDVFFDSTLNKAVFYVGNRSSTGWVDSTGAAA